MDVRFSPNATQSGHAGKGYILVYWCYIAMSTKVHIKIDELVPRYKNVERAGSFKSIN